mgnify:CR=1 FL=1
MNSELSFGFINIMCILTFLCIKTELSFGIIGIIGYICHYKLSFPNFNSDLPPNYMEQLIKLGQQINKRREQLRLTQWDMAEITQLSDATIRAIEKGKPTVAMGNWIKVADVLGLEVVLQAKRMSDETRKSI